MRILIIEDEASLSDIIKTKLKEEKYNVDTSLDGEEGLEYALSNIYDLIILDIMLPKVNGIEILKQIKENNIESKVILLTAKSSLEDKLLGFDEGANDYVTKPFHIEELIKRVNVQLRNNRSNKDILKYSDLELNIRTSSIKCIESSETINLSFRELIILEYLITNSGLILSKDQLYNKVWGIDNEFESNNLEAYLSFIRKKLKIIDSKVNIKVVRGLGYKLE